MEDVREQLAGLVDRLDAWKDEPFVSLTPMRKADVADLVRDFRAILATLPEPRVVSDEAARVLKDALPLGAAIYEHESYKRALKAALPYLTPVTMSNDGNSEADFIATDDNACPACGGSGHKDDALSAPAEAQPVAERDVCIRCGDKPESADYNDPLTLRGLIEYVRVAADPNQGAMRWHALNLLKQALPHLQRLEALTAPPSAPVGVDGWVVETVEDDPNLLVINTPNKRSWIAQRGDRVFELAEALALAQQPAADGGFTAPPASGAVPEGYVLIGKPVLREMIGDEHMALIEATCAYPAAAPIPEQKSND